MSKFMIVCCIALLAPAICFNTSRLQRTMNLQAAKEECIRGIQTIYITVLNTTIARTEADLTEKNLEAENRAKVDGNVFFHKIIGKANALKSMSPVVIREPIPGIPVYCTESIMAEIEFGVSKFLPHADTLSVAEA